LLTQLTAALTDARRATQPAKQRCARLGICNRMTASSQTDVRAELVRAARTGDEAAVRRYSAQGVVDRKVLGVALHLAVAARHAECCRVLLFSGADVDEKNSHGSTSMHVAAEAGAREVMQVLLEFQASLNIRNADGKCAIAVSNNSATRQLIAAEVQRRAEATEQRKRFKAAMSQQSQNAGQEQLGAEKKGESPVKRAQQAPVSFRSPLGPKNGDNHAAAVVASPAAAPLRQPPGTPELLMCRVCLRDFCSESKTDPVSLPCGHTFCSTCIDSLRGLGARVATPHSFRCPLDRQVFSRNLDFKVNTLLREIIPLIRASCGFESVRDDGKPVAATDVAPLSRPTMEAGTTTADMLDAAVSPMTPAHPPGGHDIALSPIFPFQMLLRRNTTGQSPTTMLTPTLLHSLKARLTPPSAKQTTPHRSMSNHVAQKTKPWCADTTTQTAQEVESVLNQLLAVVCKDV